MSLLTLPALLPAGFLASGPVQTALAVGGGAALVSAIIGVFTVIRGQSFAGHALADLSSAGGAAAFLLGISPLWGFLGIALIAAGALEAAGLRHGRQRDLATGIVMGAGLGLTALLLHFAIAARSSGGAAVAVMFGSIFAIPPGLIAPALLLGAAALAACILAFRPLLLTALGADLAAAQGLAPRAVSLLHLVVLALAVTLSAMTVGAILSTALLIGPAAAAVRLARSPGRAVLLAMLLGLATTWGGILLAYVSYDWTPGHAWPVSFFVVSLIFVLHLLLGAGRGLRLRSRAASARAAGGPAARGPAAAG